MADIDLRYELIVSDVTYEDDFLYINTIYCHIEDNSPKYYAKKQAGSIAEIHFDGGLMSIPDPSDSSRESMGIEGIDITGVNILGDIDGRDNTLTQTSQL